MRNALPNAGFLAFTGTPLIAGGKSGRQRAVVGTSTGGISALGLAAGLRPRDVVEFYSEWGPKIFRKRRIRTGCGLWRRRYGSRTMRRALSHVLGTGLSPTASAVSRSWPMT
jgi:hypothetical protein